MIPFSSLIHWCCSPRRDPQTEDVVVVQYGLEVSELARDMVLVQSHLHQLVVWSHRRLWGPTTALPGPPCSQRLPGSAGWPCLCAPDVPVPLGSLLSRLRCRCRSSLGESLSGALKQCWRISFLQHWTTRWIWTDRCSLTSPPSKSSPLPHSSTDERPCPSTKSPSGSSRACEVASGSTCTPGRVPHSALGLSSLLPFWPPPGSLSRWAPFPRSPGLVQVD